jgi:hypothetical protein
MKSPCGFSKNYFTFASIQAHSVAPLLASRESVYSLHIHKSITIEQDELEAPPPDESVFALCELNAKPCLCNYFYKLKTKIALLINHYIPRCPYYTVCFAFRRSGIHPPLAF